MIHRLVAGRRDGEPDGEGAHIKLPLRRLQDCSRPAGSENVVSWIVEPPGAASYEEPDNQEGGGHHRGGAGQEEVQRYREVVPLAEPVGIGRRCYEAAGVAAKTAIASARAFTLPT